MKKLMLPILLLSACDVKAPNDKKGCVEFFHNTTHKGKQVQCTMLWCQQSTVSTDISVHDTGGVATLWCDEL